MTIHGHLMSRPIDALLKLSLRFFLRLVVSSDERAFLGTLGKYALGPYELSCGTLGKYKGTTAATTTRTCASSCALISRATCCTLFTVAIHGALVSLTTTATPVARAALCAVDPFALLPATGAGVIRVNAQFVGTAEAAFGTELSSTKSATAHPRACL